MIQILWLLMYGFFSLIVHIHILIRLNISGFMQFGHILQRTAFLIIKMVIFQLAKNEDIRISLTLYIFFYMYYSWFCILYIYIHVEKSLFLPFICLAKFGCRMCINVTFLDSCWAVLKDPAKKWAHLGHLGHL